MIARQLRNLHDDLRSAGWRSTAAKVGKKCKRLIYSSESLDLLETQTRTGNPVPESETRLQSLSFGDLLQWQVENATRVPDVLESRYRDGDSCWGVFHAGQLVHIAWTSAARLPIDRGAAIVTDYCTLGIYDMYTWPQHRGHGFQTYALRSLCIKAEQQGFARALAVVHPQNRPSLTAFARAGFTAVGKVHRRTILGVEVLRVRWLAERTRGRAIGAT
jgi:GNAT superfamily N-acetyltransferase